MTPSKHTIYRRYTSLPIVIDMITEERLTIVGYDSWIDVNDRYNMDLYKKLSGVEFLGAYCVNRSKTQEFHQWKVFADGDSGVCVVFDQTRFEKFYKELDSNAYLTGGVNYVPYRAGKKDQDQAIMDKCGNADISKLPFIKRSGFYAEQEFRIVHSSMEKKDVHHIQIDTSLISEIILSPFLDDGLLKSVKGALKSIKGCPRRVTKARLTDSKMWQEFLSRYAEQIPEPTNA